MMISRFHWFLQKNWWQFVEWAQGPSIACYNCVDCQKENFCVPDGPQFYCMFRGEMTVEPTDTCRAFKGWRKT